MFVVDRDHACVASESCRIFLKYQTVHLLHSKIRITRCKKSRFYPVLAKIRIKTFGYTEDFYKENRKKSFVPPVLSGFGEDPD